MTQNDDRPLLLTETLEDLQNSIREVPTKDWLIVFAIHATFVCLLGACIGFDDNTPFWKSIVIIVTSACAAVGVWKGWRV